MASGFVPFPFSAFPSMWPVCIWNGGATTLTQSCTPRKRSCSISGFSAIVDAEEARKAWLDGFEGNCKKPCSLDPRDIQRFLAAVPPVHNGDETVLLFTPNGVSVWLNGQSMGAISDPHFAEIMLATFIGVEPPTPRLKRQLLGSRD